MFNTCNRAALATLMLTACILAPFAAPAAQGDRPMAKVTDFANSPYARLDAVPVDKVTLQDDFWKPKRDVNHHSTIPHQYAECERTGRIDNFRRAAGRKTLNPVIKKTGDWGILAKDPGHPIFKGLDKRILLVSGGIQTQDECCYWDNPNDVHGKWLADWQDPGNKVICAEYTHGKGKVITLGTGAYFWYTAGETNNQRPNQERLTKNILAYLGAGPVLFIDAAASADSLPDEPKAAFDWLSANAGARYASFEQIQADPALLDNAKVIWWHFTGEPAMPQAAASEKTLNAVKSFIQNGGGLFLSDFGPQYVATLGLEPTPPTTIRQVDSNADEFRGIYFNDSDVYKWMEAAAFSLASYPDPELDKLLDGLIELIAEVQEDDGYLNTFYMFENVKDRWTNLTRKHELYLGGHMIQGAVAHHRATGKTNFLDIATKWADCVDRRFGPGEEHGAAGHPEIEMALVELYRDTGEKRYLDLASFFVEERGKGVLNSSPYLQDHAPIREQTYVTGHAVRQLYLTAGVADLYAETGDQTLMDTLLEQWDDFFFTKMYITGGAGARHRGEAFGDPYELPNDTAYAETCAAIASFMWNWRMLQLTADAKYADVMEQTLYNNVLSGVSLDGKEYFYVNPLENDGGHRRTTKHFDGCACCPPNVARTLAELPGYLYGIGENLLYVHHYIQSVSEIDIAGQTVKVEQKTGYPWDGAVTLTITPASPVAMTLAVRWPAWAESIDLRVNGQAPEGVKGQRGQYVAIGRTWQPGDTVQMTFPMEVHQMAADPRVRADEGKIALMRGPVVFCFEQIDQPEVDLAAIAIPKDAPFTAQYKPNLLGGITVLTGSAASAFTGGTLYERVDTLPSLQTVNLTAIPYFAWANRDPGPMKVWLPAMP